MTAMLRDPVRRPARRVGLLVALTAALVLLCCGGGVSAFLLGGLGGNSLGTLNAAMGCGGLGPVDPDGRLPRVSALEEEHMRNAAIIINVGAGMDVPPRGWVIAVATALQESYLRNLGHLGERNDHDSLGLFQQRPSQGWGTPEQILDPRYASRKFYERLLAVPDWHRLPLTVAAQRVQRSAYPDAYAKHEPLAALVVNVLADGAARAVGVPGDLRCAEPGEIAASGWTAPVRGVMVSGFRTPQRPAHHGVDLGAPRGTLIRVASAGVVVVSRCNASTGGGAPYSCDRDGSPYITGCGWYVDVLHAGGYLTRYCHMVSRPLVAVGQRVAAGEVIGRVGSSGNSSGPHLHYETHVNGDRSNAGAVDPEGFMAERGAPLGSNA
jgi:murein DD-endopeptidase MepM/ murein hydrolase activator NlpD